MNEYGAVPPEPLNVVEGYDTPATPDGTVAGLAVIVVPEQVITRT